MSIGVMKMNTERLTITVEEAAILLGLSRNSAYQGIATGEIPHIKVGKRILIPRIAFEKMLGSADSKRRSHG
jgi:excisionase family DNA binding protein